MSKALRVVVDTDCGIDDAFALVLLLTDPQVEVVGISATHGTTDVDQVVANLFTVLETVGRHDISVYKGAAKPLRRAALYSPHVHGETGLGSLQVAKTERRLRPAHELYFGALPGDPDITVLTLGPLTTVAPALFQIQPTLEHPVKVVAMGGTVSGPGNRSPVASSNLYKDPEAASILLGTGADITFVTLDTTNLVVLDDPMIQAIVSHQDLGEFYQNVMSSYRTYRSRLATAHGLTLPDVVAASYLQHPEWFTTSQFYCEVETTGELTRGQTIIQPDEPPNGGPRVTMTTSCQAPLIAQAITERLTGVPTGPVTQQ